MGPSTASSGASRKGSETLRSGGRSGFTIVEVIVALVILATGVLGLAGTTALVIRQITLSDITTERSMALQGVLENLRAIPWDSIDDGSDSIGEFELTWTVSLDGQTSKQVSVVTTGPGLTSAGGFPGLASSVADTFTYRIRKP